MNYLQQFGGMLGEMEDGELKTNLLNAFGNVKLDFNQAIEKRTGIRRVIFFIISVNHKI